MGEPAGKARLLPSPAAFYATNVFQGIRIYWNDERQEVYAFRLQEHFTRWFESMKMMRFSVPSTPADLGEALREVVKGNNFKEDVHGYLVAYVDAEGPFSRGQWSARADHAGDFAALPTCGARCQRQTCGMAHADLLKGPGNGVIDMMLPSPARHLSTW